MTCPSSLALAVEGARDLHGILDDTDLLDVILAYVAIKVYESKHYKADFDTLRVVTRGLGMSVQEAVSVSVYPDPARSWIEFFRVNDHALPIQEGNNAARVGYRALRFVQTQVHGTGHMFFFLFTSPKSADPLTFAMHTDLSWQARAFDALSHSQFVRENFHIDTKIRRPAVVTSKSSAFVVFVVWSENLRNSFTNTHITEVLQNLGVGAEHAYSLPVH